MHWPREWPKIIVLVRVWFIDTAELTEFKEIRSSKVIEYGDKFSSSSGPFLIVLSFN